MISVTRAGCWWIVLAAVHCSIPGTLLPAQASPIRTIHVFVALADNEHQGIVPVAVRLGKGLDAAHNLYWGALRE